MVNASEVIMKVKKQKIQEHILGLTFNNQASLSNLKQELRAIANGLSDVIKKFEAYETKANARNDANVANDNRQSATLKRGN